MSNKRCIILSLPIVWGIRNFLISGIAKELESSYDVYYGVPEVGKEYMLNIGVPEERLLMLKSQEMRGLQLLCFLVLRAAHRRRFPTSSDEVFKSLTKRKKGIFQHYLVNFASVIFSIPILYRLLGGLEKILFRRGIDTNLKNRVESINPVWALSTSYVVSSEWPLFSLLNEKRIKICAHILSFDNLTSRGYLPIQFFDHFLVWNEKMEKELQSLYSIPSSRITITGTPQFDFHIKPQYTRSREWTYTQLGLNAHPYVVYCANHYVFTPDEPKLVEKIIGRFKADTVLSKYQFILRLHPMDDYDRWNALLADHPSIRVSYPWPHRDQQNLFWGEPSEVDLILFSNMLRYCDLVLNISSSISIDAAVLDKPVVCVGFSSDVSNTFHTLYKDFHYSDHYAPIMKTGAIPLSDDLDSLIALSLEGVQHPQNLSLKRKQMIQLLCGDTDGLASRRITEFIVNL
jgi:hypothetical protein